MASELTDRAGQAVTDWPCWSSDGWEAAAESSMQRADKSTRGQAAATFANELGVGFTAVRVVLRHVRFSTYAECWDDYGRQAYLDRGDGLADDAPMPPGWTPLDDDPVWRFTDAKDPRGVAFWVCTETKDQPPPRRFPRAPEAPDA